MTETLPAIWPAMPTPPGGAGVRAKLREAGGARAILPGYLRARPRANGLLLSEYLAWGLQTLPAAQAQCYLGALGAARLALQINRLSNRRGLVADKMLFDAVLRGSGLPVPELKAVFGRPAPPGAMHIRDAEGLRELLSSPRAMPLFGKPAQGQRSQDVIAAVAFDEAADCIHMPDGQIVPLATIITHLRRHHRGTGYLFQGFIDQHPELTRAIGPAVATVRLITLFHDHGIHVIAGGWKVPRAGALADTPARGNLAAPLDVETGRVSAALDRLSADANRLAIHPDTGAQLDGLMLPHWPAVLRLTRRAAGLIHVLPLIGWDIALGRDGPVFVEANTSPSLEAYQILSGRGAFDGPEGLLLRQSLDAAKKAERNKPGRWRRRLAMIRSRIGDR